GVSCVHIENGVKFIIKIQNAVVKLIEIDWDFSGDDLKDTQLTDENGLFAVWGVENEVTLPCPS
ncbi:hypothetical protein PRIPAC_83635, partial [Pristionchus pacificus]|uniref:Uncharacterized protein n=1 Tax=Pristionchus pacificus TaxID=54126 RepID=A0A2A6C541_PRIPA